MGPVNVGRTKGVVFEEALMNVLQKGKSIRWSARAYGIPYVTLRDHVEVRTKGVVIGLHRTKMTTLGKKTRTIFSQEQEEAMKLYVAEAADICLGLTGEEAREFAYKCGLHFRVTMPAGWSNNKKAELNGLRAFASART